MNRVFKDFMSRYHLKKFCGLIEGRVPVQKSGFSPGIGDHLLFFNAVSKKIGRDGYFDDQCPRNLLKDPRYVYSRRVWAKGQIDVLKPLQLDEEYQCREKVEYIKRIRGDHYVCIERLILGNEGERILRESRTLAYTNSLAKDQTPVKMGLQDYKSLGTFNFRDLDIVIYGQLSSNPHRIHWDRHYSQVVEGYRDIIVQGPFALQVLLKFAESYVKSPITKVQYRNYNYIYPDTEIEVCAAMRDEVYEVWMADLSRPDIIFLQATVSCQ